MVHQPQCFIVILQIYKQLQILLRFSKLIQETSSLFLSPQHLTFASRYQFTDGFLPNTYQSMATSTFVLSKFDSNLLCQLVMRMNFLGTTETTLPAIVALGFLLETCSPAILGKSSICDKLFIVNIKISIMICSNFCQLFQIIIIQSIINPYRVLKTMLKFINRINSKTGYLPKLGYSNRRLQPFSKTQIFGEYPQNFEYSSKNNKWKKKILILAAALSTGLWLKDRVWMKQIQQNYEKNGIVYLHDQSQLYTLGLQGHVLLWYQTVDNQLIDKEVEQLLIKFVEQRDSTISTPYKIVIDRTPREHQDDQQANGNINCELVVVKPDNIKPIELNKFLNFHGSHQYQTYSILYNKIAIELNECLQINITNLRQFVNKLSTRSTQSWILMPSTTNQPKAIRKNKKKFKEFIGSKQAFGQHVQKAMVTDEQTLRFLGIDPSKVKPSSIFILTAPSDNLPENQKMVNICGQKFHVLPSHQTSQMIFPPYLQKSHSDSLYLRISVDSNQNVTQQLKNIYTILRQLPEDSELRHLPKYLTYQKDRSDKNIPVSITLEKNNFDSIIGVYQKGSRQNPEEKRRLLLGSHKWKFPIDSESISADNLVKWYQNVKNNKEEPHFESQNLIKQASNVPISKMNSKRITGQFYENQIKNETGKLKVVFHFSPHCFSCKNFKHLYEQLAAQMSEQLDFFRINNDENKSPKIQNFNSTPVFIVYKNNPKTDQLESFTFKHTIFTKKVFRDFLNITREIKSVDSKILMNNIDQHIQAEELIKELIETKPDH